MDTLPVSKNFEKLPESLRQELREFLSDRERFQQLKRMLQSTGLMLEKDDFQIPIHSVKDLDAIKKYLLGEKEVLV